MAKTKFNIITSTCVPLPLENVDTDQIIPARFLKATTREEKFFGDNLFRDWRYNADGSLNKDFVLNDPTYSGHTGCLPLLPVLFPATHRSHLQFSCWKILLPSPWSSIFLHPAAPRFLPHWNLYRSPPDTCHFTP